MPNVDLLGFNVSALTRDDLAVINLVGEAWTNFAKFRWAVFVFICETDGRTDELCYDDLDILWTYNVLVSLTK